MIQGGNQSDAYSTSKNQSSATTPKHEHLKYITIVQQYISRPYVVRREHAKLQAVHIMTSTA